MLKKKKKWKTLTIYTYTHTKGIKKILIHDLSLIYVAQFLCNIKHSTWSYEKEFRCTNGANAKGMPYIDAIPKAIYIGMKCNEKNKNRLTEIARTLSIPVYQMHLEELSGKFSLEEVLIKSPYYPEHILRRLLAILWSMIWKRPLSPYGTRLPTLLFYY